MIDTPSPADVTTADPDAERAVRHLRGLAELGEIGLELARALRRRVVEAVEAAPVAAPIGAGTGFGGDVGLAFSRIARAVRQTFALEARMAQDERARAEDGRFEAQRRRSLIESLRPPTRKETIRDAVEMAIEADRDEGGNLYIEERRIEALLADLDERLDEADEADLMERPIGEVVTRICADLGVAYDPDLWADEDWADEVAAAVSPGAAAGDWAPADGLGAAVGADGLVAVMQPP
ncbi:MAG: hypothetical protein P4M09_21750 [Devosia sp.]|nr:hypothetical protein [Devosia sp.]